MELVETSVFTRQITGLLSDEEYRRFQSQLVSNPAIGPVIRGGGGIRKVRVAVESRESGGARVIYYWAVRKDIILLLYAYPKNEAANLTTKQTALLAKAVKEEFGNENQDV